MKIIILAGGTGTGLWPVSRIFNPKQFTKFKGLGKSTFQMTLEKSTKIANIEDILIVTNKEYKYLVLGQLQEINLSIPENNILLEPSFKNTLHAVSMGVFELLKRGENSSKLLIIPSNSVVSNYSEIFSNIEIASAVAFDDYILTFGVNAAGAYIGYGYIKAGESCGNGFKVERFVEKPAKEEAESLVKQGYMYNSGVLYFSMGTFLNELKALEPKLYELFSTKQTDDVYLSPIKTTIEHGLLERSSRLAVVSLGEKWNSINEFSNFYKQYDEKQDSDGNIAFNENVFINAKNNLVYADGKKVVSVIGVDNLVVIDQPDALLVCNSADTDKVRDVASILKKRNDPRAEYHTTCYRPWGSYTVLEEGAGYKIKRITVLPGKKLSYQMHYHRSEHWVVVTGTATVTRDGEEHIIRAGESVFLSVGEKHRMENPGKTLLEVIEVQIGAYLCEDDIVRFDDEYGRMPEK